MTPSTRVGLSLSGVLVVVVILVMGVGLFLPATRRARIPAERMQCQNNLHQLMVGVHTSHDNSPGEKAGKVFPTGCVGPGTAADERLSWMVAVLPYLEQGPLYQQFDMNAGYEGNLPAARNTVTTLLCPAGREAVGSTTTHYIAMAGIGTDAAGRQAGAAGNGFMGYDRPTSVAAIRDGTSNTIALLETRSALGPWARGGTATVRGFDPADVPWCGDRRPFGGHPGGTQAAMVDGSVRFLRSDIDPQVLVAAITVAGGEPNELE